MWGGVQGFFKISISATIRLPQRFLYDFCDLKSHRPHRSQATPSAMHILLSLNQPETKYCKHFQSPVSNSISINNQFSWIFQKLTLNVQGI